MLEDDSVVKTENSQAELEGEPESGLNQGPWEGICLDDGSGRNVHYIDKNGKKSRLVPPNYVPETFSNGMRKYYYRGKPSLSNQDYISRLYSTALGKCIRCKKQTMPSFIIAGGGSFGFGMNYCDDCLITTTPGITKIAGNGDAIWAANLDTPMHAYIDLIECINIPNREQVHLERSKEAKLEVNLLAKQRRNEERAKSVRQFAMQFGIGKGEHLSWGFGEVFDEYYGEVNDEGEPHGMGLKIYADKSTYIGHFKNGLRHSTEPAIWMRPDGM
eukprot:gene41487-50627_t